MNKPILPPKTFLAYSLGCRTNQAEMEDISLQLMSRALSQTEKDPDIILLNTCVVTQKAEKETRQKIRELRKKYPKSFLVVLGCAVTAKEIFKINLPQANLYIPNNQKNNAAEIICHKLDILTKISDRLKISMAKYQNKYQLSGRKFIKIQNGCDNFCSYCVTCHLRGKPTSVPSHKIIREINSWVCKGIKEIILTGINLGLWTAGIKDQETVSSLLDKILSETKIERISFSSIYPEMLNSEFVKLVVNNPRITQCFHFSLQSGSQTVLERMNRETDLSRLKQILSRIKRKNPFFTFRADIIVGFPNETEEEFRQTLDFIKKAKISFVHHFHFSMRPHTKSEVMIKLGHWKEIPPDVIKQRVERLGKEVKEIHNNEAMKQLNTTTKCLIVRKQVDHYNHGRRLKSAKTTWEGITENGWPIRISIKYQVLSIKGKILPAKITGFDKNYLLGEIVSLPINGRRTSGISTEPSAFW